MNIPFVSNSSLRNVHRYSKLFLPRYDTETARQETSCKSLRLMLQYGLIYPASTGIYHLLPFAVKAVKRLTSLIQLEMENIGGQQVLLPCITSRNLWTRTGRWKKMNMELMKFKDRHGHEFCLGPTHEEAVTEILSTLPQLSHKLLPIRLYQVSVKFRDERRPRFGLLRAREFYMKDMYTFDESEELAEKTYSEICEGYTTILKRLRIPFVKAQASTGPIGGKFSHEYHFLADIGEDSLLVCEKCGNALNSEEGISDNSLCYHCGTDMVKKKGIEVGHAFSLGTTYSKALEAYYYDRNGKKQLFEMGCYGLGVTRIIAAALEILSTDVLRWPASIAPYTICVVLPKRGSHASNSLFLAEHLATSLNSVPSLNGQILVDDREDLTVGKRIKHLDSLGIPYVIIAGKKSGEQIPKFELQDTSENTVQFLTHSDIMSYFWKKNSYSLEHY